MASRTAAGIFADLFLKLAEDPEKNKELIEWAWNHSKKFDFHACQMNCNEVLKKLGLARKVYLVEYPDEYEWVFKGETRFDEASF